MSDNYHRNKQASIVATNVSKSFLSGRVSTQVLCELSVSILPAELTLITGPSGCGKSTLLSILCGLQKCDEGRVEVMGEDLTYASTVERERFRLHYTGFVFQGFNLFSALTALEQVELPLQYLGIKKKEVYKRALQALDEVNMTHKANQFPAELSGGEKQRIAIARALVKTPKLLFADEPTSALDAASGAAIIELLHRIASVHKTTVLCVSHDPRLINHADRVLAMEDGEINRDWRTNNTAEDNIHSAPHTPLHEALKS